MAFALDIVFGQPVCLPFVAIPASASATSVSRSMASFVPRVVPRRRACLYTSIPHYLTLSPWRRANSHLNRPPGYCRHAESRVLLAEADNRRGLRAALMEATCCGDPFGGSSALRDCPAAIGRNICASRISNTTLDGARDDRPSWPIRRCSSGKTGPCVLAAIEGPLPYRLYEDRPPPGRAGLLPAFAMDYHGVAAASAGQSGGRHHYLGLASWLADPTGIRAPSLRGARVTEGPAGDRLAIRRLAAIGYCFFGGTTALELARSGAAQSRPPSFLILRPRHSPSAGAANIKAMILVLHRRRRPDHSALSSCADFVAE